MNRRLECNSRQPRSEAIVMDADLNREEVALDRTMGQHRSQSMIAPNPLDPVAIEGTWDSEPKAILGKTQSRRRAEVHESPRRS